MALLKKDYGYSSVLWEDVLTRIKEIIVEEYNFQPYIAPDLDEKKQSPFRIWPEAQETTEMASNHWFKRYTISVNQYLKKETNEKYYEELYKQSERLYELFFLNMGTKGVDTSYKVDFYNGTPTNLNIIDDNNFYRLELLYDVMICRDDDKIYIESSPSVIRAAIRAIEPSYNFWSLGFDGTDDQINAGSGSNIDNIFDGGGTISMWINPIQQSNTMGIIQKRYVGGWQFLLSDHGGGTSWRAKFVQEFDGGSHYQIQGKTRFFSVGNWYNIVISYNNSSISNTATIYVNGQVLPINTNSTPLGTRQDDSSGNMVIGDTGQYEFSGAMSDVALFNVALSSSTIETMYNNGSPILLTQNQGSYNSSGNLVAYYRMGSGNGDIRNSQFLRTTINFINDQTENTFGSELIVSQSNWVLTDSSEWNTVFTGTSSTFTSQSLVSGSADAKAYFNNSADRALLSTSNLGIGAFKIKFSISTTGTLPGLQCRLVWYRSGSDDIVYNIATEGDYEIDEIMTSATGNPHFQFLASANGQNVTISNISCVKYSNNPGKMINFDGLDFKTNVPQIYDKALFSNSLAFDGSDEGINSGLEGLSAGSSFSFSAWINGSDFSSTDKTIISNGQLTNHRLFSIEGGKLFLQIYNGGYSGDNVTNAKASTTFSTGVWYNVIATFDGSNIKLYVNGVEETTTEDGSGSTGNQQDNTTIGYLLRSTKESFFNGNIADVAVYSAVLDQTNVTAIYNSGKPIDLTCDAGNYNNANNLLAYWKMGDGYLDQLPSLSPGLIIDQVSPIIGEELVVDNPYVADYYQLYTNNTISTISGRSVTINLVDDNAGVKIYLNNTVYSNATGILNSDPIDNEMYLVSIDVVTDGTGQLFLQNVTAGNVYSQVSGSGTHKFLFKEKPSASATIRIINFSAGGGTFMTWSNISVKKVEGNPGFTQNMNASSQSISVPK